LSLYGMGFPNRSMKRRGNPTDRATVPPPSRRVPLTSAASTLTRRQPIPTGSCTNAQLTCLKTQWVATGFSERKYATIASRSSSLILAYQRNAINGTSSPPSRRTPVVIAVLISWSDHIPIPV
jgi:hypothetical protein